MSESSEYLHSGETEKNQPQLPVLSRDASRELDALIAERVMGEPKPVYTFGPTLVFAAEYPASRGGMWREEVRYDEGDVPTWRPLAFSTDIAAAWMVMERMRADGFSAEVTGHPGRGFHCHIYEGTGTRRRNGYALADAAPLAICRAALLAVEEP